MATTATQLQQETPHSPAPTPASAMRAVVVKLSFRGETHRVTLPLAELTYEQLRASVRACYDDADVAHAQTHSHTARPAQWTLVYRDNEEDLVIVSTPEEFAEARRVFLELKAQPAHAGGKAHMHFHVVAKLSLKEQLAPVLHVVEEISGKMARLAADTRESLRKSAYVERGRESMYSSAAHTRSAISSARRSISSRLQRASSVVAGEISELRERRRSRLSSQDVAGEGSPVALMATDVEREGDSEDVESIEPMLSVAELLARARAEEEAEEQRALEEEDKAAVQAREHESEVVVDEDIDMPALEPAIGDAVSLIRDGGDDDVARPSENSLPAHASDAETDSTGSEDTDRDWDVVSAAGSQSSTFAVDLDDHVELECGRWTAALAMIHDVMPQVDSMLCVELLEKHDGNLERVLVELTEL